MKYTQCNGEASVSVSAGELSGILLPAEIGSSDARRLSRSDKVKTSVRLSAQTVYGGISFDIYGTADAVLADGPEGTPVLFEFTCGRTSDRKGPSARAVVLAFLLSSQNGGCDVAVRTVVTSPDFSCCIKTSEKRLSHASSEGSVKALLSPFIGRARFETKRAGELLPTLRKLKFPHVSLREGQKTLIDETYTALRRGDRLFAQAPTGIGKTVSVMYGALRAMGNGCFRRIFYLTAKASTGREAFAAAARLYSAGSPARTAVLAAKEQICPYKKRGGVFVCDPAACPLMKGYAEKAEAAKEELLSKWRGYSAGAIADVAQKHGICPYELSLDLAELCDVVICDYNYAFSPSVRLRRFFETDSEDGFVFLVDEAHNLPERARDMFSSVLRAGCTEELASMLADGDPLKHSVEALENALESCAPLCNDTVVKDENGLESGYYFSSALIEAVDSAVEALETALKPAVKIYGKTDPEKASSAAGLLRQCTSWRSASESYGPEYRTYISIEKGRLSAELYCLDPSERLGQVLEKAHATVFFSATLTPSDYYSDILSGGGGYGISLPSPFPAENLYVAAFTSADTRWEAREGSVKKIASVIASVCSAKAGNYLVFFPSYRYLESVAGVFSERYPKVRLKLQKPGMTRAEREEFIGFFADDGGILRIGFCVLGGSFSEGIDLPGKRLIGTVIVGTGLPGLSAERNIIREYYDVKSENGFDYAYVYPGMNGVLQAAGRVIRRDTDRGCVVLVDPRYSEERYKRLMPPHWKNIRYPSDAASLRDDLRAFWGK